jgi:hypothetical protein
MTITEKQKEALLAEAARLASAEHDVYRRAMSGADMAEAPAYGMAARALRAVAGVLPNGVGDCPPVTLDEALARADAEWRAYAEKANAKVAAAPKIKRGPYQGASSMHYRWVSPDFFATHRAYMVRGAVERATRE